ncbi:MAG: prephenate dehydrogenase/arogenate dehydrogenase family protein [Thermodesulfobacteriaceae bacterium]|nr:prephenate dehydrogenase/arogenate dehydrogenase family protein [Thermodesulfobacteriaceae bacterium]MCX8041410.1 prephenate dehydrogenase/arogenate dehydrogenase family protein [Thermodesulfobacteriaceae bacterium]MDW8135828.1 prephenate dehydrogenase/arogenate dehydrogenase family protein [Thermodesulfobacterium sp.]
MEENFTIGIIGGAGKMGNFFKAFFEKKGYKVLISDLNEGLSKVELLKQSKVILLSVPMETFPQVVEEIGNYVKPHHWILDICSLKVEPVRVMKKFLKRGEILATHPLFGPYEKSLRNKIIVLYRVRGKNCYSWFKETFLPEGVKLVEVSPQKHDQIIALSQVLNHFWLIILAKIIKDLSYPLEDIINLSPPSFERQLHILKRFAYQDEKLYAKIQLDNPLGKKMRRIFYQNCKLLTQTFNQNNYKEAEEAFLKYFKMAKELAKRLEELLGPENF